MYLCWSIIDVPSVFIIAIYGTNVFWKHISGRMLNHEKIRWLYNTDIWINIPVL